ncbi:hypothetical protein ACIGCM_18975 [Pseudomonas sp. NPDC078700]|uniref:hypothetical protein n=1 Tax=Pseudomonas sp. NPDC078700 TaxID=3364424 RepID=UPI0037C627AB
MSKTLQLLMICLLMITLPAQGMAVISMQSCVSSVIQPKEHASTPAHCDNLQSSAATLQQQNYTPCVHCSMCMSVVLQVAPLLKAGRFKAPAQPTQVSSWFIGYISDIPERPPRNNLA